MSAARLDLEQLDDRLRSAETFWTFPFYLQPPGPLRRPLEAPDAAWWAPEAAWLEQYRQTFCELLRLESALEAVLELQPADGWSRIDPTVLRWRDVLEARALELGEQLSDSIADLVEKLSGTP